VTASFAGNNDYNTSSSTASITIAKATTITIITIANVTYNGSPQGGTALVTGDGGLSQSLTVMYVGTGTTIYASSSTAPTNAGTYTESASYLGSVNYFGSSDSKPFTITPAPVSTPVTVIPTTVQYSDQVTFTANITGGAPLVSGGPQAAASVTFKVGTQTLNATPLALTVSGSDLTAALTAPLLETVAGQMAPGDKTVYAVFNSPDNNYSVSPNPATTVLTITQENATGSYNGVLFQATPSATATSATITLSAIVQDIADGSRGDIRNACISFVVDGTTVASGLKPALINSSDLTTGIVNYNYNANVGSTGSTSYTVGTYVGCYYDYDYDETVVTVYQPVGDFITGGGYIIPTQSSGSYASDAGKKTNFGFNVKYNKTGKNLQGNMNIIFRRTVNGIVRTYQIKANSMTSLGVNIADPKAQTAVFVSKANLTDITNPLSPQSLGGGLTLQVNMTDKGEPGKDDMIAISLWNGSTLLYSSNWTGTKTGEMILGGGNLVVHREFSLTATGTILKSADTEEGPTVPVTEESAGVAMVPNGFSPNGDGINDYFQVGCVEKYPDAKLLIYSGNSALVYSQQHYGNLDFWGSEDAAGGMAPQA
jgi:hypothetical protein